MCGENGLHAVVHAEKELRPGGGNAFRTTVLNVQSAYKRGCTGTGNFIIFDFSQF